MDNGTALKGSTYNIPDLAADLAKLKGQDLVGRIWGRDHTVWKPDPTEIADRLGWLSVTTQMSAQLSSIMEFAGEVRRACFRHVVLLGMGGSSLGPEVLRQTFGSAQDYPELIVLDSTVPGSVESVARRVDPQSTLFLVSSKSGTTTEPNSLYDAYFRIRLHQKWQDSGSNFAAITDAGTPPGAAGQRAGVSAHFPESARYWGPILGPLLLWAGAPAALIGMELPALIARTDAMRAECSATTPLEDNPGVCLGLVMAQLALQGRDKLTLLTSPSLAGFGLWVEQLLAESTGKEGRGIVPVAGEPLLTAPGYSPDRLFIFLRLEENELKEDDNSEIDAAVEGIQLAGHPLVRLDLKDKYDLGGEFYRWEFATALAGALLGINPFDQPDVQGAKDMTDSMLAQYQAGGRWPLLEQAGPEFGVIAASLGDLLARAGRGDYLAIMAYLQQTPAVDWALDSLRSRVSEQYRIATTMGYGPRFLHSTGQLHKGGPNSGLFLQITQEHPVDVSIPGQSYTFGTLVDAQSRGDFRALLRAGRRAARVHLAGDPAAGITQLVEELSE